jgi:hypothetical protein
MGGVGLFVGSFLVEGIAMILVRRREAIVI